MSNFIVLNYYQMVYLLLLLTECQHVNNVASGHLDQIIITVDLA